MKRPQGRQKRWAWAIAGAFLLMVGLVASQAYAAAITVTSQPLQNATSDGSLQYSTDYSGASSITRHESSDLILDGSDKVTSVTVGGNKTSGSVDVKVDLLDGSGTIVDTATVALPTAAGACSQAVTLTGGTTKYHAVAKVSAAYTTSAPPAAP